MGDRCVDVDECVEQQGEQNSYQFGSKKQLTSANNIFLFQVFVPDLEIAKTPMAVSNVFAHGVTNLTNLEHFARTGNFFF